MKEGWEIKAMRDVCTLYNGRAYKKTELLSAGKYPVLRVGNFFTNNMWYHSNLELEENKYCEEGDLLYAWSASFGPRIWTGPKAIYHYHIWKVVPHEGIDRDFLFHLLEWDKEKIKKAHGMGTTMMHVGKGSMEKRELPIPPLPEQQRIVYILDKAFAAIDTAKANAEQNLQNAKELFDCVLDNILYDKKWEVRQLGEVCKKVEYGTSSKAQPQGKLPVMRMGNIQNGRFDWESLVFSDNEIDNKKYLLKFNDVLFNRTNSPELVGKTAIYKGERPAIFAGYLIRVHRKEDLLDADYLNYFLNSKMAFEYGQSVVTSSVNQANINGTKLKSYPIPLPSLKQQQSIVRQLDALRAETQKLEAVYQRKIDDLEELKKSILQKAFAGELDTSKSSVPVEYEINDNFSRAAEPTNER